jgi:hypothetical protein
MAAAAFCSKMLSDVFIVASIKFPIFAIDTRRVDSH